MTSAVLTLSPTDLANHLACPHLTTLDVLVATGQLSRPKFVPQIAAALRERGIAHENAYVDALRAEGLRIVDLSHKELTDEGVEALFRAMQNGADAIVQAPLCAGSRCCRTAPADTPSTSARSPTGST